MNSKRDLSGFEVTVGVTRSIMIMIGAWPDPIKEEHWILRYYFLVPIISISFFSFIPQTTLAILVRNDFNKLLEVLCTAQILIGLSIIKLVGITLNKRVLKKLVLGIWEDWNQDVAPEEQSVMWHNAHISRTIALLCITTISSCIFLQVARVLLDYYFEKQHLVANASLELPVFLEAHFFFDVNSSPMHEIIFTGQVIVAFFIAGCFSSFDGFFVFAILHLSGQLQNLQMRIKNIINESNKGKSLLKDRLKPIIYHHQRVNRLASIIERSFNKMFLAQIIATCILLCLQSYQFVKILDESSGSALCSHILFFLAFLGSNTLSIFMYCYVAENLRTESEGLFSAVYNTNWYDLSPDESKLLIPFMVRTMKPIEITVGKFGIFSLKYFASILKTSAGYLSMLLAVKDRF